MGRESTPLDLITNVWPPRVDAVDITTSGVRWGPFDVGDVVRVAVNGNAWYKGGDSQISITSGGGAPLGAWMHVDHQIQDEDNRYIYTIIADGASTGLGVVFRSGKLESTEMAATRDDDLAAPVRMLTQAVATLVRSALPAGLGRALDRGGQVLSGGAVSSFPAHRGSGVIPEPTDNRGLLPGNVRPVGSGPVPALQDGPEPGSGLVPGCD